MPLCRAGIRRGGCVAWGGRVIIASVKLCECGCGLVAPLAKHTWRKKGLQKGVTPLRFIRGHSAKKRTVVGYRQVAADDRRVGEHVRVCELAIGRRLPKGAIVHHVDGDIHNNANANLVICESHQYHMILHYRARVIALGGDPDFHLACSGCSTAKAPDEFYPQKRTLSGRQSRCKACQAKQAKLRPSRREAA